MSTRGGRLETKSGRSRERAAVNERHCHSTTKQTDEKQMKEKEQRKEKTNKHSTKE